MDFSANLSLPFLLPNQAQKHVTVNESLLAMDALVQLSVLSAQVSEPPASPVEGERYIVAASASGTWSGLEGQVVCFQDGSWKAYAPHTGWQAHNLMTGRTLVFDGTDWADKLADLETETLGINASADLVNRLSVKSPAALFDHDGADHQLKLNKADDTDTASLVFQSAYSGHAELGLIGDTDFSLKVSADGQNFLTAITVQATDGFVGVGTDAPISKLHIQEAVTLITLESTQSGAGAAFDLRNLADDHSWRLTGSPSFFKIRDHTGTLDKIMVYSGPTGQIHFKNCGDIGIGKTNPSTKLDVEGAIRVGQFTIGSLPSASGTGAGTIIFVGDESGGAVLAFSDGTDWRRVTDRSIVS